MKETIGIFADRPDMPTGMAVVCHNLAINLSLYDARIIYFGRFGQERGFSKEPVIHEDALQYELVNCEGGVWRPRTVIEAVEHYGIDYIFSEDDFFSAGGLVRAALKTGKPLHFLTPVDSLPIHPMAHRIFKECAKVYVPNSSYKQIKNGVYLPHGVQINMFFLEPIKRDPDKFTFLWIGRDEPRKAMGRAILAFERVAKKFDCQMIIHSDWRATLAKRTARYIRMRRNLPIIMTQMESGQQAMLRQIYNTSDALICTSKAGGFEMSITEAMACGKVPLVTDWTFMNEAIKSYENGFLIPIANTCGDTTELYNGSPWGIPLGRIWGNVSINALAETMGACLTDQDLIKEMGKRGIEHVRRNYDWLDISGKLYREIMK